MLWIKALHIVFVTAWFAGLFYLPRILVNLAMLSDSDPGDDAVGARLITMARKLYRFMTLLAVPALGFGLWLWIGYGFGGAWLSAKLLLVMVLVAYHYGCGMLLEAFEENRNTRSHVWFRWFNEVPVIILLLVVILVVVKPF